MEGLAYLTFDADVKEDLVEDKNALLAMFELAKVELFTLFVEFAYIFHAQIKKKYVRFRQMFYICVILAFTIR